MLKTNSILGSLFLDFSMFYGTSFAFLVSILFFDSIWNYPVVSILVFLLIDSGHVYTTLWRTYFRQKEFRRSKIYIFLPLLIFIVLFFWSYLGLPYLWMFIIYFTLFHHIRQYYGVFRWYAKLDQFEAKSAGLHLYVLVVAPIVLFHFREINYQSLYHVSEFKSVGPMKYFDQLVMVYLGYYLWQTLQMVRKLLDHKVGWGLLLSFLYPATLHLICFLFFNHSYQIFLPLLTVHGLTYLALMASSMRKLDATKTLTTTKIWCMILGVILVFTFLEVMIDENYDIYLDAESLKGNMIVSLLVSSTLLPNILHYILDAFLWKKDHPDFPLILSGK